LIVYLKKHRQITFNINIETQRTGSSNDDFKKLVTLLDQELSVTDGEDHDFYHQFNHIDKIKHVLVAYEGNEAIGCGAIKAYDSSSMEVKRMYTRPEYRGKGVASKILNELENWAKELSYQKCILETGIKQPEAIALYKKNGYSITENYGQYAGVNASVCFEKKV
jgi:putative acetyltransferase